MIIALYVVTYVILGFLLSMLLAFVLTRTGMLDGDELIIYAIFCIILWPLYILIGVVVGIVAGLSAFYEWFSNCISERDKEEQ